MLPFFVSYEISIIRKTLRKDRAAAEGKFSLKHPPQTVNPANKSECYNKNQDLRENYKCCNCNRHFLP